MNIIQQLYYYLRYREAVRKAEMAHFNDSDRYYVLPYDGTKLMIVDRKNFKMLKRKGYIDERATMKDVMAECFYFTAGKNQPSMSQWQQKIKLKQYYAYITAVKLDRKKKK